MDNKDFIMSAAKVKLHKYLACGVTFVRYNRPKVKVVYMESEPCTVQGIIPEAETEHHQQSKLEQAVQCSENGHYLEQRA